MARKRRLFTGTKPIGGKAIKSRKKARKVTSEYHKARHELISLETSALSKTEKKAIKETLEKRIDELGGETVVLLSSRMLFYVNNVALL
jgi:hypothetical protein